MKTKNAPFIQWLALLFQCVAGLWLLWWISSSSGLNVEQLAQRLNQASPVLLLLGILCFLLSMALGALRYHLFLPKSISLSYLFGTALLQNALLTFMPWRTGEISYPLLLRRDHNISVVSSTTAILAIRLTDLLVVLAVALVSGAKLGLDVYIGVSIFVAVVVVGLSGLIALRLWGEKAPARLQKLVAALAPLYGFRNLIRFLALSAAVFAATTMQSTFILRAMGFDIALIDVATLNALGLLVGLLPIHPPGGWGTIDTVQVLILERLGYNAKIALIAILAAHSFYTMLIFVGGVIGWLIHGKNRPALQATS
jgi:uncharacterized membrane protein YbhN (UPF0104 family)